MNLKLEHIMTIDEFLEMLESIKWKNEHFYEKAVFKYKPEKITGMYLWTKK